MASKVSDQRLSDLIGFASRGVLGYEPRDVESVCRELQKARRTEPTCEWVEVEADSGLYNTCEAGEEFQLRDGMDLWPHCHLCGGKIVVGQHDKT